MKKILVLGWAGHGKDTVSEILRDEFGLSFESSSRFCVNIARPYLAKKGIIYDSDEACFQDRVNHRSDWYTSISELNKDDPTHLGRLIFEQYDIYCGLRNIREFAALKAQLQPFSIWVDSSARGIPPESSTSCTIKPEDADVILRNDGTLDQLREKVRAIMLTTFPELRQFNMLQKCGFRFKNITIVEKEMSCDSRFMRIQHANLPAPLYGMGKVDGAFILMYSDGRWINVVKNEMELGFQLFYVLTVHRPAEHTRDMHKLLLHLEQDVPEIWNTVIYGSDKLKGFLSQN